MDITAIIGLALTALFGLIARYLIPWLRAKLGAEKLADVIYWVEVLVRAAEQWQKDKNGAEKLEWVLKQLANKGFTLEDDAIRAIIEAQVREIKLEAMAYSTD